MASTLAVVGVSVPHYWLGMVLVIIFSVELRWFPATGAGPGSLPSFGADGVSGGDGKDSDINSWEIE